jgi:hypothetical protein
LPAALEHFGTPKPENFLVHFDYPKQHDAAIHADYLTIGSTIFLVHP